MYKAITQIIDITYYNNFNDLAGEAKKIVRYLKKDSRLSDLRRIERKI